MESAKRMLDYMMCIKVYAKKLIMQRCDDL